MNHKTLSAPRGFIEKCEFVYSENIYMEESGSWENICKEKHIFCVFKLEILFYTYGKL